MGAVLIVALLIGLIPAAIAQGKGRSFVAWWLFGAALFIVALPMAIVMKPDLDSRDREMADEGYRKCPWCAEMIRPEAIVCKHCGRDVPVLRVPSPCSSASSVTDPTASVDELVCGACGRPNPTSRRTCFHCGKVLDRPKATSLGRDGIKS